MVGTRAKVGMRAKYLSHRGRVHGAVPDAFVQPVAGIDAVGLCIAGLRNWFHAANASQFTLTPTNQPISLGHAKSLAALNITRQRQRN